MASDQEQRKAMKQIYSEIVQINKKSVYDDEAHIAIPDTDNPRVLEVSLTPRSGYYQGGEFKFKIVLPEQYPNKPPTVSAITKMYHPNISYSGNVCLNILSGEFDPNYRLEHYINALLWLLLNPNFDSQLNGSVKRDTYAFDVVLAMRGFPIGGTTFEKTLVVANDNWEPSEDLRKVIFQSLWGGLNQKNPKITIQEFLKEPETQEWIKFEPGLQRMLNMNLEGIFVQKSALNLVPQNAILKNSIWTLDSKPILILTASYNNGKPCKELIAKFLEAKEDDLLEASGNVQSLCGMPEDKVSIFSWWNKFDKILINDNVFIYETVVVPSWFPTVLFQIKSSVFQNFPDSKVGKFTSETAGAVIASTSTVDAWYQTIKRTISVQDFLNEPKVKDWVKYDPLTLFFMENAITGDLITRESLATVPDDVLAKITLWAVGTQHIILVISAESEKAELSKELIAKAAGVEAVETANADALLGCSLSRIVPFCLPAKITKVLVNEELFKHEQISLPVGPGTWLNTNPGILKFVKEATIVPVTVPRVNPNFPKKPLFAHWVSQVVQQPDKNVITVNDVLQAPVAAKWRNYDVTAQYLTELGLLDCKFVTKESERWIPDEVIARPAVWSVDGKLVALIHSEKQDPTTELVAQVLGEEPSKVFPIKDTDYQAQVGASKAAFTILYPTPTITKILISESLLQHKFSIVQLNSTFCLQVPSNCFANWKHAQIASFCPPKPIQRKSVFNEWHSKYATGTVAEFLKTPHVADWATYDPTTRLMLELQLEGVWKNSAAPLLAPDDVYLRQYVFPMEGEVVVVLAAKTDDNMLNKELLAKALGVAPDKVNQAEDSWFSTVGALYSKFSVFNPVTKARVLIDEKAMQHKAILICSGHNPMIQMAPDQLLKFEKSAVAPLTCAPNEFSIKHISDAKNYEAMTQKQKRVFDKAPKKSLLLSWVKAKANTERKATIESLAEFSDYFSFEPVLGCLQKVGAQGHFKLGTDAQKVSTRAAHSGLPSNQVLKELLWVADGKPVLAISNGDDPIDPELVAAAVGCSANQVIRPKKQDLPSLCGLPAHLISAFSPDLKVDKIVINQRILDLEQVSTTSGSPGVSLIIKPDVFTRIPNVIVANLVNPQMVEEMTRQRREREQAQAANNNNNNNAPTTDAVNNNNATTNPTEAQPVVVQQEPVQTATNTNQTS